MSCRSPASMNSSALSPAQPGRRADHLFCCSRTDRASSGPCQLGARLHQRKPCSIPRQTVSGLKSPASGPGSPSFSAAYASLTTVMPANPIELEYRMRYVDTAAAPRDLPNRPPPHPPVVHGECAGRSAGSRASTPWRTRPAGARIRAKRKRSARSTRCSSCDECRSVGSRPAERRTSE